MVDCIHVPVVNQCLEIVHAHQYHKTEIGLQQLALVTVTCSQTANFSGPITRLAYIQICLVDNQLHYTHAEEELDYFRNEAWNGSGWPSLFCEWLNLYRCVCFFCFFSPPISLPAMLTYSIQTNGAGYVTN